MASTPPKTNLKTSVTVLLIALLAIVGATAILLLTVAHQPWAGLACVVVTLALLVLTDHRLRRRAKARRGPVNSADSSAGH